LTTLFLNSLLDKLAQTTSPQSNSSADEVIFHFDGERSSSCLSFNSADIMILSVYKIFSLF